MCVYAAEEYHVYPCTHLGLTTNCPCPLIHWFRPKTSFRRLIKDSTRLRAKERFCFFDKAFRRHAAINPRPFSFTLFQSKSTNLHMKVKHVFTHALPMIIMGNYSDVRICTRLTRLHKSGRSSLTTTLLFLDGQRRFDFQSEETTITNRGPRQDE